MIGLQNLFNRVFRINSEIAAIGVVVDNLSEVSEAVDGLANTTLPALQSSTDAILAAIASGQNLDGSMHVVEVGQGETQELVQLVASATLATATPKTGIWTTDALSRKWILMVGTGNASRTVTVTAQISFDGSNWFDYKAADGSAITIVTWTPANAASQALAVDLSSILAPHIKLTFTAGGTDVPLFAVMGWGRRGY